MHLAFIFIIISNIPSIWAAKILTVSVMPSYSHYILMHALAEELAHKGHQVTMIAPYRHNRNIENYTEIYLDGLADQVEEQKGRLFNMHGLFAINQLLSTYKYGYFTTEFAFTHKRVEDLLKSNTTFDVVIISQFLNEGLVGFSYKFKAHTMYLATLGSSSWSNHLVANPAPLSYIPNFHLNYKSTMNFWQRMNNLFLYIGEKFYRKFVAYPYHNQILHNAIPDAPNLNDLLYKRDAFVLVNSHISTNEPVPHVPNMVEIGGFHVKNQNMSEDLRTFLDNSVEGVVYFSMGSNLPSSKLPPQKRAAILKALGKLKQNVLWKWEEDSLPNQPPNVKIAKWFPQQAILAHPNTKAFISHGGLLSIIESVYFGVPTIGIPIFGDQGINIKVAVNHGFAVAVPYSELTEEALLDALNQIIYNDSYRNNIQSRSALMRDRKIHPLDEAVYWIEHVTRHNGSWHFRSSAMDLTLFEYEMIDIAAFLIIIAIITVLVLAYFLARFKGIKLVIVKQSITDMKKQQ